MTPPCAMPSEFSCVSQLHELSPIRATERDVVKPWPQLIERLCTRRAGMAVNAEQRAAEEPHDVVERAGVLVEHRIHAE